MVIDRKTTTEYPTRYVAFGTPGIVWEQTNKDIKTTHSGHECAVYHEPHKNTHFIDIIDEIYSEIYNFQNKAYGVSVQSTRPDRSREQHTSVEHFTDYERAVAWMIERIAEHQKYMGVQS